MNALARIPAEQIPFSHSHVTLGHVAVCVSVYVHLCGTHWLSLTSAGVPLLFRGRIRHFVLSPTFSRGLPWRSPCCLSDPTLAAWRNKLPGNTCSLNTPNFPKPPPHPSPPSKITTTVPRRQSWWVDALWPTLIFSPLLDGRMTERPAGRKRRSAGAELLLADDSGGSKAPPLASPLASPLFPPRRPPTLLLRDVPSLPLFSPVWDGGKQTGATAKRQTGGWWSEVWDGTTGEVGSGEDWRGVGVYKETNWESRLGTQQQGQESPSCHNWLSPPPPHTDTQPVTHAPNGGMHWGSGECKSVTQ